MTLVGAKADPDCGENPASDEYGQIMQSHVPFLYLYL
jgi:hypothetical protein